METSELREGAEQQAIGAFDDVRKQCIAAYEKNLKKTQTRASLAFSFAMIAFMLAFIQLMFQAL